MNWPFVDLALARRLERCEAHANARSVEARARFQPEVGAAWIDVAGAFGLFDGVDSMATQSFGVGCFEPFGDAEFEQLEHFFVSRGAPVQHEVSPLSGEGVLQTLVRRNYVPLEQSSVLFMPLGANEPRGVAAGVTVRRAMASEAGRWADVSARGWSGFPAAADVIRTFGLMVASREDGACFFAELNGEPIATGAVGLHGGVALLSGASTITSARGRGAQNALLAARLAYAQTEGCDLAMMGAMPGSSSQRNAERQGFRIACTRTKWIRH